MERGLLCIWRMVERRAQCTVLPEWEPAAHVVSRQPFYLSLGTYLGSMDAR